MIESILRALFPKTIRRIKHTEILEWEEKNRNSLVSMAEKGISFYVFGDNDEEGKHDSYEFVPHKIGKTKTVIIRPNPQPITWGTDGELVLP